MNKLFLSIISLFAIWGICFSPAAEAAQSSRSRGPAEASAGKMAIVNVPAAGVYARDSVSSEQVTEGLLGDELRVDRLSGGWARVSIPSQKGYSGWIQTKNILSPSGDAFFKQRSFLQVKARNTALSLNNGGSLSLSACTRLPILRRISDSYEVLLPDGRTGTLPASACILEDDSFGKYVSPEDIMYAAEFLGADYKWGGITASGMDCSGFVYTVFRINGIYLKRDSYMQANEGTDIPVDKLQAGDLLFFRKKGDKRISHVGIYIGNGDFIHASKSHNAVTVSSLNGYKKSLAGARRILKSDRTAQVSAAHKAGHI